MTSLAFRYVLWMNLLLRKAGLVQDYDLRIDHDRTIYPETTKSFRKAVFVDGQLEKIRNVPFGPVEGSIAFVMGGERVLGPIRSITLKNCYFTSKFMYSGFRRMYFTSHLPDVAKVEFREDIDVVMPSSFLGCHFFGHWVRDDCATHLMASEEGEVRAMPTPDWEDRPVYETLFGQDWPSAANSFHRSVTLYHDIGQNAHKAQRFRRLREMVRSRLPSRNPKIVYIRRGSGGRRRALLNEDAVIALLRGMGAHIHEPEHDDAAEFLKTCLDADIVVSVEGSQLSHALYVLRDGGGVLALQPPDRFFSSHADWAGQLDMRFAFVVGDPAGDGFTIDVEALARTLDLLAAELDRQMV